VVHGGHTYVGMNLYLGRDEVKRKRCHFPLVISPLHAVGAQRHVIIFIAPDAHEPFIM
jgi:hypothetical protein